MSNIDTFWNASKEAIYDFFEEFKGSCNYINFRFKYNWANYPEIEDYLKRIFYSSYANNKNIRPHLQELIKDVEEFFYTGIKEGLINKNNLGRILASLKDKDSGMRVIEPIDREGIYGKSVGNKVQINLGMTKHPNSPQLSAKDVRRLYIFHEIGHKIINISDNYLETNRYTNTLEKILKNKGIDGPDLSYSGSVYNGLLMIEECLVQEMAEILTYSSVNKKRPNFRYQHEIASLQKNGFEDCVVKTNLDFYGLFQTPTINLGRTIRGCSTSSSTDTEVLHNMIKKALNKNFTEELFREYNQGDGRLYYDLFLTLRSMGFIQIQKYATFGQEEPIKGILVSSCLNAINNITKRNYDFNPYPQGGYPRIEYEKFISPRANNYAF